jgi:RNA polymerase sigma-70 factor (ECF subfamily)
VETEELRELVTRAKRHDPDAWEALYRRAHSRLLAYARRRLATREQAEDAVSDTMSRALRGIDTFEWTGAGFDAWLTGILRNVVLEGYRRTRRGEVPATGIGTEVQSDEPGPAETVLADEDRERMKKGFASLDDADRELLELRVVVGLDSRAVGEVLSMSAGAVRMAQVRALNRLRAAIGEGSS